MDISPSEVTKANNIDTIIGYPQDDLYSTLTDKISGVTWYNDYRTATELTASNSSIIGNWGNGNDFTVYGIWDTETEETYKIKDGLLDTSLVSLNAIDITDVPQNVYITYEKTVSTYYKDPLKIKANSESSEEITRVKITEYNLSADNKSDTEKLMATSLKTVGVSENNIAYGSVTLKNSNTSGTTLPETITRNVLFYNPVVLETTSNIESFNRNHYRLDMDNDITVEITDEDYNKALELFDEIIKIIEGIKGYLKFENSDDRKSFKLGIEEVKYTHCNNQADSEFIQISHYQSFSWISSLFGRSLNTKYGIIEYDNTYINFPRKIINTIILEQANKIIDYINLTLNVTKYKIDHNDVHVERGVWRKYNPYNPYEEGQDGGTCVARQGGRRGPALLRPPIEGPGVPRDGAVRRGDAGKGGQRESPPSLQGTGAHLPHVPRRDEGRGRGGGESPARKDLGKTFVGPGGARGGDEAPLRRDDPREGKAGFGRGKERVGFGREDEKACGKNSGSALSGASCKNRSLP